MGSGPCCLLCFFPCFLLLQTCDMQEAEPECFLIFLCSHSCWALNSSINFTLHTFHQQLSDFLFSWLLFLSTLSFTHSSKVHIQNVLHDRHWDEHCACSIGNTKTSVCESSIIELFFLNHVGVCLNIYLPNISFPPPSSRHLDCLCCFPNVSGAFLLSLKLLCIFIESRSVLLSPMLVPFLAVLFLKMYETMHIDVIIRLK